MEGDVVRRFTAWPLTPIHVGDGSLLAAEAWRLSNDGAWLERFDPAAVLRACAPERRRQYLDALDRGDLKTAQRLLRESVRPELVLERIAVGAAAARELREVVENPLRRGDVRPFVRTGARPYLPGSSIKGALRTALLSSLVPEKKEQIEAVKRDHRRPNGAIASRASNEVQALLLTRAESERERRQINPDQDPFRFVEVADILLPEAATRVDRVVNWRPTRLIRGGKQPAEKMQMIFEVTGSAALGQRLPLPCEIRIEAGLLRAVQKLDRSGRKTPSFALDATALARAVNAFHWKLWDDELERFYRGEPMEKALRALVRVQTPEGTTLGPDALRQREDVLLLRVGRFGQFESKSLEGVREGWNAQAKPARPMQQGNTRNLVKAADTTPLLPLGWLLLLPEGFEPVVAPAPVSDRRGPPPPDRARRAFYGGEEVKVVRRQPGEILIEFEGGDTEWVDE
ncbi:MAG: type III-A CRISPR-associated RAMP protein Csm5, partial [Geminicoccaceae bacterium]|nr:type III-A CRISPR-associated RAMP protein Csm5 [Geminicoccaceae bacterium]